jgi:hypothetical protein
MQQAWCDGRIFQSILMPSVHAKTDASVVERNSLSLRERHVSTLSNAPRFESVNLDY